MKWFVSAKTAGLFPVQFRVVRLFRTMKVIFRNLSVFRICSCANAAEPGMATALR